MQSIKVLSLTSHVDDWLETTGHPRILHIFDRACNLIDEHNEVLSIVTQQIGDGPFNLVIEDDMCFAEQLSLESQVSASLTQFQLGDLTVHTGNAKIWNPCPDWEVLHTKRDDIVQQLTNLPITNYLNSGGLDMPFAKTAQGYSTSDSIQSPVSNLSSSLATADLPSSLTAAGQLAGLGAGLTPTGDDYIMGAIYAAWIIHPPGVAAVLAHDITNVAAPLTTSLSAAWLRSAGQGEAGILWHEFFDALISAESSRIQETLKKILAVGATSGADALAGFARVIVSWMQTTGFLHG